VLDEDGDAVLDEDGDAVLDGDSVVSPVGGSVVAPSRRALLGPPGASCLITSSPSPSLFEVGRKFTSIEQLAPGSKLMSVHVSFVLLKNPYWSFRATP
jgi:hypothetical protein